MVWNTFFDNKDMLLQQYSVSNWNVDSGLSVEELKQSCDELYERLKEQPKEIIKAKLFALIMEQAQIEVNPYEWFADKINHGNILLTLREEWKCEIEKGKLKECLEETDYACKRCAYKGNVDFSHVSPDWDAILELGIPGLLKRVENEKSKKTITEEQKIFYDSCIIVYKAVICFIQRLSDEAKRLAPQNEKMLIVSQNLSNLTQRAPETLIEAMQLTFLFYYLQTYVEGENVRSIGGLDRLYERFYINDVKNGNYSKEQIKELIDYFLYKFYALKALSNTPFYLCGVDEKGKTVFNELTSMFIEEYDKLNILDPKIHIRYTPDLPNSFVKKVLKMIIGGRNSILFINDDVVIKGLVGLGEDLEEARNYAPIGCYEPAAMGKEIPCSCAGSVILPKAVEVVISGGYDSVEGKKICDLENKIETFDDFYSEVKNALSIFISQAIKRINAYEKEYMNINPSPLFSGTMYECVKKGKDVYAGGAKYNNTSINAVGIASAIDSILAIKKLVFEEKKVSFSKFAEILKHNWQGYENLRLHSQNCYNKYGNDDEEADALTVDLVQFISSEINGKNNGRGGVYRCGFFSIDWYSGFGKAIGALPDGKLAGEPISKNMSPTIGQDKNGVTALINSVTKINYTQIPNGTVLDLLLHSSCVNGEEGPCIMLGILKTFMVRGGITIQFNVLNPEILRQAQQNPEKFKNLQIRLCGWNVYFVDLSEEEQNEFMKMSEHAEARL